MKRTPQTVAVLELLRKVDWAYGYEIMQQTGLASGTLYPILDRFTRNRLVALRHERINPRTAGRPPRVYYRITNKGRTQAALWREQ